MKLSIIMPFLNEKKTLKQIISQVLALDIDLELIIVEELAKLDVRLTLLRHPKNRGKGFAIRTGIPFCKGEIITIQDADPETNPSNLEYLI